MGKDWNSANSLFTFSVCCHPEILLPWPRDVTTSPLYTRCYSPANADVFPVFASPNRKVTFRVKRSDDRKYVCIRRLRCYLCSSLRTSRFFEQGAFLDRKLWTKGENIGGAQSRCVDLWDQHMFWKNPILLCWSQYKTLSNSVCMVFFLKEGSKMTFLS